MATIYAIECEKTGFVYIGCTRGKIGKRMREHRCLLNSGLHKSTDMVSDWRRYGPDAFKIRALDSVPDDLGSRRTAELGWLGRYATRLYNAEFISFSPSPDAIRKGIKASRGVVGNRWTPEANLKRRLAQLGKPKNHGHKISATKRAQAAAKG